VEILNIVGIKYPFPVRLLLEWIKSIQHGRNIQFFAASQINKTF